MEEIIQIFENAFANKSFTSSERKAVKEMIIQYRLDKNAKNLIRSRIFDLARNGFDPGQPHAVIDWLEKANKALFAKPDKSETNGVYFSPGDSCLYTIVNRIKGAASNVKICVFTISDDTIVEAILHAHMMGVNVKIITDNDKCTDTGSDIGRLSEAGIEVRVDNSPNHMHHKFAVVDSRIALTGSYNWTRSAAVYNHENLLITDEKRIVSTYAHEFDKLWEEMVDFKL